MRSNRKLAVIKLGGHAMDDAALLAAFAVDIARLSQKGMRFIVVHGGGPHINALLQRLGIESTFVNGLRVTDRPTLEAVELALCATVNKAVIRHMHRHGCRVAGISGQDGSMLKATVKDSSLGHVGRVTSVNPDLLVALLKNGFIPVVAPLALDQNSEPLNVNADTAAGAIAGAMQADYFVLISDVPGILDSQKCLIPRVDTEEIANLRENGTISGGMLPKVESCQHALANGCRNALILNGKEKNSLGRYLEDGEKLGTLIIAATDGAA